MKHGTVVRPTLYLASLDKRTAFDEAGPKHVAKKMDSHNTHGWIIATLLREMSRLSGKAVFECVESSFAFNRCFRQGSVEVPMLANVEEEWMKQRRGVLMDIDEEGGGEHHVCSFMWADNFCIVSHSKKHLEQMLKALIEEAAKVDLESKLASLWWTSTYASDEKGGHDVGYFERLLQIPF